ncbi:replication initiation protein, partial [Campylobacter blaseri]
MKPLVKYDNELNMIAFKAMTQVENNVFFALLHKLRDKGTKEVVLDFTELKRLIGFESQSNEYIIKSIQGIAKKIAQSVVRYETDEVIKFFTLFQVLEVPKHNEAYIRAKISETFAYLINDLKQAFTVFEIAEFSALSSRYTQTLYRLLKQFRSTGYLKLEWSRFIDLMDIPHSYEMRDINKQILKPALKELGENQTLFNATNPIFKNLKMNKIRGRGRGRPVTDIEFTFKPETTDNKATQEKKTKKQLEKERKEQEFREQFYTKKFSLDNLVHTCLNVYKQDDKYLLETEYYNKGLIRKNIKFDNLEQIKKLIKDYEKNNQVKDRPG